MKKRIMIVAFMVLALIFTAGCGSEKNEEQELETKSAGYHIMNRRSSNMTREDGFCETFTSYINGKTFEKGDRLSLKEAFGEYQNDTVTLNDFRESLYAWFTGKKIHTSSDQDYYDYVMEFPKRMYIEASYDENKIYINAYVDKVDEPVINVK